MPSFVGAGCSSFADEVDDDAASPSFDGCVFAGGVVSLGVVALPSRLPPRVGGKGAS